MSIFHSLKSSLENILKRMCSMAMISLVIFVSVICLNAAKEIDKLNLCDTSAQITVKHAFVCNNSFVLFFEHKFETYVSKSVGYDLKVSNKVFELEIKDVDLWKDWYIDVNGTEHKQLKDFTNVYNIRDEYIVYITKQHYYKVVYNQQITRIVSIAQTNINDRSDALQVELLGIFQGIPKHPNHNQYLTCLRFPSDDVLPKRAFVYEHLQNDTFQRSYVHIFSKEIGSDNWVIDDESGARHQLDPNYKVVSAFPLSGYKRVKNDTKYFYIVEISSDGRYKVRGINVYFEQKNNSKVESKVSYNHTSAGLYNGDIKQYIDCEVPKPNANTDKTENTSPETELNTTSQPESNKWIFIIVAIIILLVIVSIIFYIWYYCCRNKLEDEEDSNKDAKQAEPTATTPSETPLSERIPPETIPPETPIPETTPPENESTKFEANTLRSNDSEDDENIDEEELEKQRKVPEDYDETAMYSIDGVKRKMQE